VSPWGLPREREADPLDDDVEGRCDDVTEDDDCGGDYAGRQESDA
jgi:hypothetical protein